MKIAILGPSPAAFALTHDLLNLGASVRLFWGETLDGEELVKLQQSGVLVQAPWLNVTKRFLLAGQKPQVQSRFADLFRVSFTVNPEAFIENRIKEEGEGYQHLAQEFISSLKSRLEMFEDVDVVVDASPGVSRREFGPGGPAVGESRLRHGTWAHADDQSDWCQWVQDAQEVAVIGDGEQAARILTALVPWWQKGTTRIFHISASAKPFDTFLQGHRSPLAQALEDFLLTAQLEHVTQVAAWKREFDAWNELDDFIKAKKIRPEQPVPRLVVFSGHILTSVDQLVDKSRTFLTLETSPFVSGEVQTENNTLTLKTIGVDRLIGAAGTRRPWERFHGLELRPSSDLKDAQAADGSHPEVGFYTLGPEDNFERRRAIIGHLKMLFSPRGEDQ